MYSRLLAGMIAVMSIGGVSGLSSIQPHQQSTNIDNRTRIIVEVDKKLENLSKSEIISTQDNVIRSIRRNVTGNFDVVQRYSVLNNAFVMDVNKDDVEAIRALPHVASITFDKIHAKKDISDSERYQGSFHKDPSPEEDTGPLVANISAATMYKPEGTNEGEGTVIAILDNEFYLRGASKDGAAWNHAVFKALPEGVAQKFTYENLGEILNDDFYAKRAKDVVAGQEGSLYFNSKVPFYYDYGGESTDYGKAGPMDYDVSSTLTYHGSHVASIASANADTYKGIAPNAQLACMKVFTTYEASETGEQLGFGTSTGAYDSAILSALEDAKLLGVDGINMSLGSDLDDFDGDSITMKTLASLKTETGIMSAISAGNAGKSSYSFTGGYGNWTTDMIETGILGSYANSGESTIVASGQPTEIYFENAIKIDGKNVAFEDQIVNREGQEAEFPEDKQHWLKELQDVCGDTIPWVYVPGFGAATDYTGNMAKGKVAVINRGSISFADKYNTAVQNGAIGVIFINNDPTATDFNFRCSFGDNFSPSVPCALVLYKDKPVFENAGGGGTFSFIFKDVSTNDLARTFSTFSSDGARFDFDLKPDITTPGENIRGAVPPQKKEHREETPYSTYEYLSGTSMSAPNYAGAQSLVLSKVAKGIYADGHVSSSEEEQLLAFRNTVDMRLMSTANPMLDSTANPENDPLAEPNYTSPRLQGAGMVDLGKAYNTDIYLEGLSLTGEAIGKSKICLYNSDEIARGLLDLKFLAHNEGSEKSYTAKVTVMRPAIANSNKVVPDKYRFTGEIDDLEKVPGLTYFAKQYSPAAGGEVVVEVTNKGSAAYNEVIKLTKQVIYYTSEADLLAEKNAIVLDPGYYKNVSTSGIKWEPLEGLDYQSVQDQVIGTFTQSVTIPSGDNEVALSEWAIPEETKLDMLEKFEYGCAVEGYVELLQGEDRKLSIPFLGFYSGTDMDDTRSISSAPVVEPFSFEKDPSKVYPSDLVNDVTKQLLGKDQCEFGSTWTVGYSEEPNYINTDPIRVNETSFDKMIGWHNVGTDPNTGAYYDNPGENIYVGNPDKSNTMIIQQYVMRSVKDNFFTIKNADGEIVYKSILEDLLFGDDGQLYKSHVDSNYLGAGYVAHRAYAIIPLYDLVTRKAFDNGVYEIEFNYQLACNSDWVKKSYHFTIDNSAPVISNISEYSKNGEKRVRIEIDEQKVSFASLGVSVAEVHYDEAKKVYYIDEAASVIEAAMDNVVSMQNGQKRLIVKVTDAAYGQTCAIVHFFGSTYSNNVVAQGSGLETNIDFVKDGQSVEWYRVSFDGSATPIDPEGYIVITTSIEVPGDASHTHVDANGDNFCDICGKDLTEQPEEPEGEGGEEGKDEENLNFFQRLLKFFKDLFQKIGDFFKNLFSKGE